jgi:type IX secretion system PorP/SprF family membrane protein
LKKAITYITILFCISELSVAQQMPYYTQYRSNDFMLNPAISGTRRLVDARLDYRNQWVGYDGAPKTESFSLNSRFFKGTMGAGIDIMQDNIGPSKQTNLGVSYAYHIRFPDCELSAGVAGIFTKYTLEGDKILLHNTQDPAIDQYISNSTWVEDASAGIYLYNDRFHIGISALHLLESTAEFYKNDTTKKGLVQYITQGDFTLGYNYSQNPDYVWESNVFGSYTKGAPIVLDYTLRLHYKGLFFVGASIRLRDAIALHLGVTILQDFQVSYSYDILIGPLRNYSSGSHEIMLIYSSNIFHTKHGKVSDKFLHQKYQYMF